MNEVRIPYKPKKIGLILGIAFFSVCAAITGNEAASNDRGLVLNRIIEFSPQSVTVFYWVITIISLAFVVLNIFLLVKSGLSKREIVITDDSITSPKSGLSNQLITVDFSDITDINIQTIQKTKILNIEYLGGKLSIPKDMLPSKASFEELVSQLQNRANG